MRTILSIGVLLVGASAVVLASGCQSQPKATPEPTPTENVVVVVVTASPQPTFVPTETAEATITPLATFTPIGLESPTPTARPTSRATPTVKRAVVQNTPKPATSATPAAPAATATSSVQEKYPAPTAISPTSGDSNSDHSDIQFYFSAVGPLGANECYLLHVSMSNPGAPSAGAFGDDFLDTAHCGDVSPPGKSLKYTLFRATFHNVPTYGTIEAEAQRVADSGILKLQWYVRVVQNNGPSPDGVHYSTIPLSQNSATLESDFLR